MKKITIFLSSLFILFAGIAVLSCSNGPEPILPPDPYDGPTYEVKFEVVKTEYWLEDKNDGILDPIIIDESKVIDEAIEGIKSHKPSFETKILEENEEYILEDCNEWIFDTLKSEVQYFTDKELTSFIESGSVVKNENKTIYVKFVYYFYCKEYSKDYNEEYKNSN